MAYTEIARLSTTTVRSSATTATNTYTLPAAPASGQWIVVSLYTTQGVIPTAAAGGGFNNLVTSVTCGSIGLNLIETAVLTSIQTPTVFAAPYQSGMTTTLSVNWSNSVAATTLGVAVLIFSGAYTGSTSGYNAFRTVSAGAFDGAGDSTFGLTQAQGLAGKIAWAQSNATIPTQYDSQQEPFISAMFLTSATNVPPIKTLTSSASVVNNSGVYNVTTDGWGVQGQLLLPDVTSVYNGSGQIVIDSPSGNFVASYTGVVGSPFFLLTGVTTTAAALGASIPVGTLVETPVNTTNTIAAILPTLTATDGTLGGFQTRSVVGVTLSTNTAGRMVLIAGQNAVGKTRQSAYGHLRISGSQTSVGGGVIYTFVPATRTLSRSSTASRNLSSLAVRIRTLFRSATATLVRAAKISTALALTPKATVVRAAVSAREARLNRSVTAATVRAGKSSRGLTKSISAVQIRAARVARSAFLIRRATATSVPAAYTIIRKDKIPSHAGQAEPGFMIPDTRTTFVSPSADGSISAPGGSSSWGVKE
jgi:hypothetical protein